MKGRRFALLSAAAFCALAAVYSEIGATGAQATSPAGSTALSTVLELHRALAARERDRVLELLAPEVVIFESGGAETSRDEYAAHHLAADMDFSAATERRIVDQRSGEAGDVAWVLTRSESHGTFREREVHSRSTETMVLQRYQAGWRIVHVHWSTRSAD